MTKKGKGIALLLAQKSKRHRPSNLKSQTPNKITFSKIEEVPFSESQEPDSQHDCFLKNQRGTVLRISRARSPTGLLVLKSKRHRSPNFECQISLDKACLQSSHTTSAFQIPHTTFSKCSDKVKTREACSSYYIATTKKGKGITLLLVVRETPIYVDLHPPWTGKPAKIPNPSSYLRGHSQRNLSKYSAFFPPIIPMQTSHTRARVSHIIRVKSKSISYYAFSLSFLLPLFLPARQGEREQSINTWNQASSQELTAWNPMPDYLPGIALEYSSSTSYTFREDTTSA
ncbi:hypothetical protein ACFX19_006781 [Malus domestica]